MDTIQKTASTQVLARLKSPLHGYSSRPISSDSEWVTLTVAGRQTREEAMAQLRNDPAVAAVAANDVISLRGWPAHAHDTQEGGQWALPRIHAPEAWNKATGSGTVVAVLDTGLDTQHPDLMGNLWTNPGEIPGNGIDDDGNGYVDDVHGIDALHQNGNLYDGAEHGTHVAGIIGATGRGISGVAPDSRLMGIKIFDDQGNTDVATIVRAINYASTMGATVLNCSWGGAPYNQALYEAMRDCGALVVCSAGNGGSNNDNLPHYPSSFELPNMVSVAASNRQDGLSFTSCYGAHSVDLVAPGIQVLSTVPGGSYKARSGSSQATPHVSGVAALVASLHPDASPEQLKDRILESVEPLAGLQGKVASGGRLDAARAVGPDKEIHGPHLLRDFYKDVQAGIEEAHQQDNRGADMDPRPDRIELGPQQTMLYRAGEFEGMALREVDSNGDTNMLVWLEAHRDGDHIVLDQKGYARDREGLYAFPLHLDGGPQTPFDPPDAERITLAQFHQAEARFEEGWRASAAGGESQCSCSPGPPISSSVASRN